MKHATGVRLARATVVLAIALTPTWAGCGESSLDVEATEKTIADRLADGYGTKVERVQCPRKLSAETGKSFSCQARLDVGTVTVKAEVTDKDGALELSPDRARIDIGKVTAELSDVLAEQSGKVLVACEGAPVRLVPVGTSFPCRAGNGEANRTVQVTVRDWKGGVDFALEG